MTIHRIPVDGASLPPRLACIDIDPATGKRVGNRCRERWEKYDGSSFNCQNGCSKAAFLYPRKRRSNGDFHFHQGIDIGRTSGDPIRSVTDGRVVVAIDKYEGSWSYYGKIVVIEATGVPYYFLYAHCDSIEPDIVRGVTVRQGQQIATVGNTFYSKENPTGVFTSSRPHLHFEVLASLKSSYLRRETQLGDDQTRSGGGEQPRLDPLYILEQLGPWGMNSVYSPIGGELTQAGAEVLHAGVESSDHGGYFPLGANNHWHGGVHMAVAEGSTLVAPFDATIVAARLDP
ncbi:MAG: M23 family metallopeptidase, partial [Nannocystaceae bacterium]